MRCVREKSSIQRRCERHNDRASNPCRSRPVKFLKTAASSQLCGSQAWMHHEPHAMDPVRIFTRARAAIPLLSHHTCTPAHPTASADSSQVQHTDDHLASDAELHTFTLTPGFTLACWRDTKRKSKPGVEAVHPSRRGTVPEIPAPLSRGPLPERGKFPSFETQGHGFEQGTGPFCLPHTTTLGPAEEKRGVHCKKPPYAAGNALQVPC